MEKYEAITSPKPNTIIINCSDPRFKIAFRAFIIEGLELSQGEFVQINVAGGPAALAHRKTKYNGFWYLIDQIRFFLRHFESIKKIVLIGHEDCGFYKTIADHPDKKDPEKKDLPRAIEAIHETLDGREVKSYYASFTDENRAEIVFEEVQ